MKPRNTWRLDSDDSYSAYNLLGAVRGPDSGGDAAQTLKEIVVRRVRGIVFESEDCAGSHTEEPLQEWHVKEVKAVCSRMANRSQQEHFRNHLSEAVSTTVNHPIWGGLGEQLFDALHG